VPAIRNLSIARFIRSPWSLLPILLTLLLLAIPFLAAADAPLTTSYSFTGNYGVAVGGIGVSDTGSGDIIIDVPGAPVQAFLYWALHDIETGGDNTISLSVNGGTAISIMADSSFGPDYWFGADPERYHFVYSADITAFILEGINTYSVSDIGPVIHSYGAGIQVIYEDPALPVTSVGILEGLDSGHVRFAPPRGPNSEVSCVSFSPSSASRTLEFSIFVAGIDVSGDLRPNSFWYQTGTGSTPSNIVDQPGAFEIGGQPFNSKDGPEWDTYSNSVPFPAGDTHACFQIESVGDIPDLLGASFLWLALGATVPDDVPTPTATITPSDTPLPTPTDTPIPTATNTPSPDPTDTPLPTATNTPAPIPTSTSTPDPTNTPSPTQTPTNIIQIPVTGFSPGRTSALPPRPENFEYQAYPELNLYIPSLNLELPIVGIPLKDGEWDVNWLWNEAGYLEGTSFPTWKGNTVITSHVYLSDGTPGPFASLDQLSWGDLVTIEAFGQKFTYEVQRSRYVRPNDLSILGHEDLDWITLITCKGYDSTTDTYSWRLAVQAVLIEIE
jgi:LPXTG-site transpeptidase (sortase) family protein